MENRLYQNSSFSGNQPLPDFIPQSHFWLPPPCSPGGGGIRAPASTSSTLSSSSFSTPGGPPPPAGPPAYQFERPPATIYDRIPNIFIDHQPESPPPSLRRYTAADDPRFRLAPNVVANDATAAAALSTQRPSNVESQLDYFCSTEVTADEYSNAKDFNPANFVRPVKRSTITQSNRVTGSSCADQRSSSFLHFFHNAAQRQSGASGSGERINDAMRGAGTVESSREFEEADYGDDGDDAEGNEDVNAQTFGHFRRTRVRPQASMADWNYTDDGDDYDYEKDDAICRKWLLRTSNLVLLAFFLITILVVAFLSGVIVFVADGVIVRNVKDVLRFLAAVITLLMPGE